MLASSTSTKFQSAYGSGVLQPFLTVDPAVPEPSWKPQLPGPFSLSEPRAHLSSANVEHPDFGDKFHFYHADLGPTNIIVSDDGHVNGTLDWESAAFYPLFCVSTKPFISAGFFLKGADDTEKRAWSMLLTDALQAEGFASNRELYLAWKKAVGKSRS